MKRNRVIETKPDIPDVDKFGKYRAGLTGDEVIEYLRQVYNIVALKKRKICPGKIVKQFYEIAGPNTMAIGPNNEPLMFRHDVMRFIGKLFFNEETYWD